jgi:hypothetical protein
VPDSGARSRNMKRTSQRRLIDVGEVRVRSPASAGGMAILQRYAQGWLFDPPLG